MTRAEEVYDRLTVPLAKNTKLPQTAKRQDYGDHEVRYFEDGSRLYSWPETPALAWASDESNLVRVKWLGR